MLLRTKDLLLKVLLKTYDFKDIGVQNFPCTALSALAATPVHTIQQSPFGGIPRDILLDFPSFRSRSFKGVREESIPSRPRSMPRRRRYFALWYKGLRFIFWTVVMVRSGHSGENCRGSRGKCPKVSTPISLVLRHANSHPTSSSHPATKYTLVFFFFFFFRFHPLRPLGLYVGCRGEK